MLLKKSGSKASRADVTFGADVTLSIAFDELLVRRELLIDRSLGVGALPACSSYGRASLSVLSSSVGGRLHKGIFEAATFHR